MKWFDAWFSKKCKEAWKNEKNESEIKVNSQAGIAVGSSRRINTGLASDGMPFTIYKAVGGYVVEFKSYDANSDCMQGHLYVVPEGEDFGVEIGKIVTMECLRNQR